MVDESRRGDTDSPPSDDPIARHLEQAGAPPPIDEARFRALRPDLEATWRRAVAEQRHRQRGTWWALAATVLVTVGVGWWWTSRSSEPPGVTVATVLAVDGVAERGGGDGVAILEGEAVDSGAGRLALRTVDGHQLRLDRGTRVLPESPERWRLAAGAVYIDAAAAPLEIITRLGTVEHIGTRYLVRATDGGVITQVRDGRIRWQGRQTVEAGRGEGVRVDPDGVAHVTPVATVDASWAWVVGAAPPFSADGRPVVEIVEHLAAENGWQLAVDPLIVARADSVRFHGSIDGFEPLAAVEWVARTAGWQARLAGQTLRLTSEPEP